ncbi:MAG: hypothetical protein ACLQPD_16910 [Desulfomonilaceae bacterium]
MQTNKLLTIFHVMVLRPYYIYGLYFGRKKFKEKLLNCPDLALTRNP